MAGSVVQGIFTYGQNPTNGASVKLWGKSEFADPGPAYDTALPVSGQVGSTATSGTTHGGTGAYRFVGVDPGDYWLSAEYDGHIAWSAVHVGSPENPIAPVTNTPAGDVTTSGTTEADVASVTLTAPRVAGQILVIGVLDIRNSTVPGDAFKARIYVGGVEKANAVVNTVSAANGGNHVTLAAVAAVAASAGQIIKTTIQRTSGTGVVTCAGTRCGLSWIIIPNADTTA